MQGDAPERSWTISFVPTLAYHRRYGRETSFRSLLVRRLLVGLPIAYVAAWLAFLGLLLAHQFWIIGAIRLPTTAIGVAFVYVVARVVVHAEIRPRIDFARKGSAWDFVVSDDRFEVAADGIRSTHGWDAFSRLVVLDDALILAYRSRHYILLTRALVGERYEELVDFLATRVARTSYIDSPVGARSRAATAGDVTRR